MGSDTFGLSGIRQANRVLIIRGQSKNILMNWAMVYSYYSNPEYNTY
jgi:hypothetical protein